MRRHIDGVSDPRTYRAIWRTLVREPRRRDALDLERGPMPDGDLAEEPYEPAWARWVPMVEAAVVHRQRSPHAATAWASPRLGDAARATGLSRERMRQLRRQVEREIEDAIDSALCPLDREAIGAPPVGAGWWESEDWRRRLRAAVIEYRFDRHGGLCRRRRRMRGAT